MCTPHQHTQADLHELRIVVASPSDVQEERDLLTGVVDELNNGIAEELGVRLSLSLWEKDAYPGFHRDGAQGIIDAVLHPQDSDILIGVFWKRWGTPVKDADSGTEHEIRLAIDAWRKHGKPHIMIYFCRKPDYPKSTEELEQLKAVIKFKEDFPKEGFWWDYDEAASFGGLVRRHLASFLKANYSAGAIRAKALEVLTGDWKHFYPGQQEPELVRIDAAGLYYVETPNVWPDGRYTLDGVHKYKLDNIRYDPRQGIITFTKFKDQEAEKEPVHETMHVDDRNHLSGYDTYAPGRKKRYDRTKHDLGELRRRRERK